MGSRLLKTALVSGLALVTYHQLKRPAPLQVAYPEAPTKILVVGGGFGAWRLPKGWPGSSLETGRWALSCWTGTTTQPSGQWSPRPSPATSRCTARVIKFSRILKGAIIDHVRSSWALISTGTRVRRGSSWCLP
jgi:hypothetical protein